MADVVANCTLPLDGDGDGECIAATGYSTGVLITIGIIISLIIFSTIFGNLLVILSPIVNRKLRSVTHMFIVSLAVADLLLAVLVLPFSGLLELRNHRWELGAVFCNLYVSFDVQICTASILHLFAISIDRYIAICDPMNYHKRLDKRRAIITITVVWAVSISISFLPLHLGWNTDSGKVQNFDDPTQCGLASNSIFALLDGLLLFYLPLTVMCCLYFRVLMIARNQARKINSQTAYVSGQHNGAPKASSRETLKLPKPRAGVDEHRATKMLGVIMGSFIICWVPYFTIFTFEPLCNCTVPRAVSSVALWLGYVNSTLNPVLYAALNRTFRRAFRKLLRLRPWNDRDSNNANNSGGAGKYVAHLELSGTQPLSGQSEGGSGRARRDRTSLNGYLCNPNTPDGRKGSRDSRMSASCLQFGDRGK